MSKSLNLIELRRRGRELEIPITFEKTWGLYEEKPRKIASELVALVENFRKIPPKVKKQIAEELESKDCAAYEIAYYLQGMSFPRGIEIVVGEDYISLLVKIKKKVTFTVKEIKMVTGVLGPKPEVSVQEYS